MKSHRFVIFDHFLLDYGGHYYNYDRAVSTAAQARGFETIIVGNHRFDSDRNVEDTEFLAWFGNAHVASRLMRNFKNLKQKLKVQLSSFPIVYKLIKRAKRMSALSFRESYKHKWENSLFGMQSLAAVERLGLAVGDHVFIPTIYPADLASLLSAFSLDLKGPIFHILLRRDPREEFVKDMEQLAGITFGEIIEKFRKPLDSGLFRIYTDTEELTALYQPLCHLRIQTLPIPLDFEGHSTGSSKSTSFDSERFKIVVVGDARLEKGVDLIPDLIEEVDKFCPALWLIQARSIYKQHEVHGFVERLRKMDSAKVRLIYDELTNSEYFNLISTSDLVLLPYRAELYMARSSGVFAEALALGIPVIVPMKTWMANQISEGAGLCFEKSAEISMQIEALYKNRESYRELAESQKITWRKRHNAGTLVDVLVTTSTLARSTIDRLNSTNYSSDK